jgi:hypothetical protein
VPIEQEQAPRGLAHGVIVDGGPTRADAGRRIVRIRTRLPEFRPDT